MSDIIHVLPDIVANQIAAGEVVLQASSVIKELVENAVDAGADHIDIYIVDSGKTLIQVVDNGKGMSEMDARKAFERHATSKISKAEDVFALQTNGFRGEALPSIAAVANVTLRTRMHDKQLGTRVCLEGGAFISQDIDVCPAGTSFSVTNLFFNMPARRAHLVNHTSAEYHNIVHEFERMALVNPHISFAFYNNNTLVHELPSSNILQRIVNLFGKKVYGRLLPVEVDTSLCRITGFVGRPDMARKKGALQYFFVNGRFMRHPFFHKAVCTAFENLIPDGEQVPYFLYFEVDPSTIDVNISPSKTEIIFHNMQAIWPIIISVIKESLGKFNAVPIIDFDPEGRPSDIPVYNAANPQTQSAPEVNYDESFNPFDSSVPSPFGGPTSSPFGGSPSSLLGDSSFGSSSSAAQRLGQAASVFPSGKQSGMQGMGQGAGLGMSEFPSSAPFYKPSVPVQPDDESEVQPQELYDAATLKDMEKSSEYFQYRGQYIFTTVRSGLMIIDQHRAHIRVLYNRYRGILNGQSAATQGLLFPELLQLSASDAVLMENIMDDLHSLGFELSPLGGGSFSVLGLPASLSNSEPLSLLNEIIESVQDTGKSAKEDLQHRLALAMARHAAVSVGELLGKQEMESLVCELFATDAPSYGPDGKTILTILPQSNIDKLFR